MLTGSLACMMKPVETENSAEALDCEIFYLNRADAGFWVVADGMGGHASGEVASKMAVDTLREFFRATSADPEATWPYKMDKARGYEENRLITGIKLANLRIHEAAHIFELEASEDDAWEGRAPLELPDSSRRRLVAAVVLGAVFTGFAVRLYQDPTPKRAMRLFSWSITYVTLLFGAMALPRAERIPYVLPVLGERTPDYSALGAVGLLRPDDAPAPLQMPLPTE